MLAAATGGLAYAVAIMRQRDGKGNRIRDYADPDKFEAPIYANIGEMESVSFCFVVMVMVMVIEWRFRVEDEMERSDN